MALDLLRYLRENKSGADRAIGTRPAPNLRAADNSESANGLAYPFLFLSAKSLRLPRRAETRTVVLAQLRQREPVVRACA